MRICHVITGLATGGAERMLAKIVSATQGDRFDHVVISLTDEGTIGAVLRTYGARVYALGLRRGGISPSAVVRLGKYLRRTAPDIIQSWMYHGNLAASVAAHAVATPACVAWNIRHSLYGLQHEKRLTRWVIRAGRFLSRGPDAIIYNSRLSRSQHEAFGYASGHAHVIPNGFDMKRFRPNREVGYRIREELGIPHGAIVVGHVARFHPMKDHVNFLRAAVHVANEVPTAHFLVVGREVTPSNPALAGVVPPQLLARFHFPGERRDVPDLMRALDLLCLSSAWGEGFPNVLGEAMATEVPCVATDVGDSAEIIGETGMVVPPRNSEALARAVLAMLAKPVEERRALGQAARARIEERYALPRIVEQYAALYECIVTGAGSAER